MIYGGTSSLRWLRIFSSYNRTNNLSIPVDLTVISFFCVECSLLTDMTIVSSGRFDFPDWFMWVFVILVLLIIVGIIEWKLLSN